MDAERATVAGRRRDRRVAAARRSPTSPPDPGAPKPDPILVADGVRRTLRRHHRRRRRPPRGAARLDHRADRAQRRRQDDVLQPADRLRQARRRRLDVRRHVDGRRRRRTRWRAQGMVRTFQLTKSLDQAVGHREHEARRHRPARRDAGGTACSRALLASAGARDRGPRRRAARRASGSTTCATSTPARCRAVSASCSRWRGR